MLTRRLPHRYRKFVAHMTTTHRARQRGRRDAREAAASYSLAFFGRNAVWMAERDRNPNAPGLADAWARMSRR